MQPVQRSPGLAQPRTPFAHSHLQNPFVDLAKVDPAPLLATFAAANVHRPPALSNHITALFDTDELPPPYGIGHAVNKTTTHRCRFSIDSMCKPISVIKKSFVTQMQYKTRYQPVTTTLARKSAGPVHSDEMVTCELVIMWNGRRRTMFIDAMVWDEIPDNENLDLVVSPSTIVMRAAA